MYFRTMLVTVAGAMALMAAPALGAGKPDVIPPQDKAQGQGNGPIYTPDDPPGDPTPGPKAGLPEKAKAYGRRCKGESKKHVKGEKGTAFSKCVTAMAKAANGQNPRKACQGLSKEHVKGEQGTEFSRCVRAAAQLKREERRKEREEKEAAEAV